jgi:hypothetical protein
MLLFLKVDHSLQTNGIMVQDSGVRSCNRWQLTSHSERLLILECMCTPRHISMDSRE